MGVTALNSVQQHLLKLFAFDSSEENLREVKEVLMRHFSKKMDDCLNELWDLGILNQEKLDSLRTTDLHKLGK